MDECANMVYKINKLDENDIEEFVDSRLKELEDTSIDEIMGQSYTDAYRNYIGIKTHYKPILSTSEFNCPDLVYDYKEPYIRLVKDIQNKGYSLIQIMNQIFHIINSYSPLGEITMLNRSLTYLVAEKTNTNVSIKALFDNKAAFCSEKSGLVHNMLKFLGVDSELVFGYNEKKPHSYNVVYPYGYGKEPMFLLDVSHFVNFVKGDDKYSLVYFYGMNDVSYNSFISGEEYKTDLTKTEAYYRYLYKLDDNYKFVGSNMEYTYGLNKNKIDVISK